MFAGVGAVDVCHMMMNTAPTTGGIQTMNVYHQPPQFNQQQPMYQPHYGDNRNAAQQYMAWNVQNDDLANSLPPPEPPRNVKVCEAKALVIV